MSSINKPLANPVSICGLQIVKLNDVANIALMKSFAAIVTLNYGADWSDVYGTPASFVFSEKPQKSDPGTSYIQELKLVYPGMDPLTFDLFADFDNQPVLASIHYSDGKKKLIGSVFMPAIIAIEHNSGNETRLLITISCNAVERARYLYPDTSSVP